MKTRALRLIMSGCVAAALTACTDSTGPGELALSLSVARPSVRANDTVTVRVEATNTGTGPVTFHGSGVPCGRLFELLKDNVVVPYSGACSLELRAPYVLEAGRSQTFEFVWYALHDGWPALITPGSYQLRARARSGPDVVSSAPVNITVLPLQ